MLLKTLGVLMVTALAFFSVIYWVTDTGRMEAREHEIEEELLELGMQLFAADSQSIDVRITSDGFEPDTARIPINGSINFVNETEVDVTLTAPGMSLVVPAGGQVAQAFNSEGTVEVHGIGDATILALTVGPEALNPGAANCARCHGPDGEGMDFVDAIGRGAPNLRSPSLADKYQRSLLVYTDRSYIELVIRYGGVVVSGDVNSPMPAWSHEVGGPLNEEQIAALTALLESWAEETLAEQPEGTPVPTDDPEVGREIYLTPGTGTPCSSCHQADLSGVPGTFPGLQTIGSELVTDLPTPVSGLEQMQADYDEDPRLFLERWIRDSAGNYNDGEPTGMPAYPEDVLPDDQLQALITYLLEQQ